jgi:hypothetical protein
VDIGVWIIWVDFLSGECIIRNRLKFRVWIIKMTTKELIALANKQKVDENTIKAFAERIKAREQQFEANRREQAATEKFMARSYTL